MVEGPRGHAAGRLDDSRRPAQRSSGESTRGLTAKSRWGIPSGRDPITDHALQYRRPLP